MPVVIDCSHVNKTDFTAAEGFKAMLADFQGRSQPVYWFNPSPSVTHVIKYIAGEAFHTINTLEEIMVEQVNTTEPLLDEGSGRMGPMIKDTEGAQETA